MEDFLHRYGAESEKYIVEYGDLPGRCVFRVGSKEIAAIPGFEEELLYKIANKLAGCDDVVEVPTPNRNLYFAIKLQFKAIVDVDESTVGSICRLILKTVKNVAPTKKFKMAASFEIVCCDEWHCVQCRQACAVVGDDSVRCTRCLRDFKLAMYCQVCDKKSLGNCTDCGSSSTRRDRCAHNELHVKRVLNTTIPINIRFSNIVVTPNLHCKFFAACSDELSKKYSSVRGVHVDWDAAFCVETIKKGAPLMPRAKMCCDERQRNLPYHPDKFKIRTHRLPTNGFILNNLKRTLLVDVAQQKMCAGGCDILEPAVWEKISDVLKNVKADIRVSRVYKLQSRVLLVFSNPICCGTNGCFRFDGRRKPNCVYLVCEHCDKKQKLASILPEKVAVLLKLAHTNRKKRAASELNARRAPIAPSKKKTKFPFGSAQAFYAKLLDLSDDLNTFICKK